MKSSISMTFKINATALVLSLASLSASAAASANAAPFGLEIGVATCDAARAKLGKVSESKLDGNDVLLEAANPSSLYEGATKLIVRCSDKRVFAVQFEASKGGMGNEASRDVYAGLARKYKRVE